MASRATRPGAMASSHPTHAADALSPICTAPSMVPSAQMQDAYRLHASDAAAVGSAYCGGFFVCGTSFWRCLMQNTIAMVLATVVMCAPLRQQRNHLHQSPRQLYLQG